MGNLKLSAGFKRLLLLLASLNAMIGLTRIITSLLTPTVYQKDLRQGYLLAQALAHGVNPYLPLPELAKLWLPGSDLTDLAHPTPHTFAIGWLCLPLTQLSYEGAAVAWFIWQLICLVVALVLFARLFNWQISWRRLALGGFLLLGWVPLTAEFWLGQVDLCLLVLYLAAWLCLRKSQDWRGGIFLGGLLALKLTGWPIVLWLGLRRRWRGVAAASMVWAGAQMLAAILHGWETVRDYYFKVGPLVSAFYRTREDNLSIWTLGQRLFAPSGNNFVSEPLWDAPILAKTLALLLPLVALAVALWAAQRVRDFNTAFAMLMGIGILLNPVGWMPYMILAAPALVLLFQHLHKLAWPPHLTYGVLSLCWPLALTQMTYTHLARMFGHHTTATGQVVVGTLPALLPFIPAVALCLLLIQLVRFELRPGAQLNTAPPKVEMVTEGEECLTSK